MAFSIRVIAGAAALAVGLGASGMALADAAADIKYRKAVMSALGAHMGAISAIVKNEAGDKAHLAGHAASVAALGAMSGDVFPAGSGTGDTKALPVAWEKPDDLKKAAAALKDASAKLADAAKAGDMTAFAAAQQEVGRSCGGCHNTFRAK